MPERRDVADQPTALRLSGLHKQFGANVAVNRVDLVVPPGSFFGLVGPNGAGKTTSLSMAVGLLRPDAGRSQVYGVDVWSAPGEAKSLMGVLPDGLSMPERLTGRELLTYLGRLRGIEAGVLAGRVQELLDVMELGAAERTLVVDYSTGMRKKIGLATALLHGPRLLVLDEPFEAVDPVSAAALKGILNSFVAAGGSVVLSSHVMPLVEQLCDTVAVMARGRVVAAGPINEVRGNRTLEQAFVELVDGGEHTRKGLSWLAS
ncbi:ABC-2 type transport system ATP-binding protein [Actinoplanes octamycinicus]|uniref:ABC-2 type transport system ATP-binding protein n=1 Tax=Actinoplanes octamycinicus TaxID=135948 RepID=A0A7W7H137_9ACTN|nr:ABC transporter ATP-binding protein [Actinoplanes octamycinicus]MBB4742040.1 ABC-2 type transport system ATP-binding protein [Actinoplanes octamycinicus]